MLETNYIFWETPSWAINWVNKVFTLTNTIDKIEEIYIWGASYRSFSYTWNTITLTDAPTVATWAPIVDYWIVTTTTISWDITYGNIIDDVYLRLSQQRTSRQYPLELVKSYIKEGIRVLNNYRQNNSDKIGSYSFNKAPDFTISSYSATQFLSGAITSKVPNTWKVIVKYGDIVNYNGRVAWVSLDNLSWLDIQYLAWDKVMVGYALSWAVKKVNEVIVNYNPLTFVSRDEFVIGRTKYSYTIIDGYLFLPYSANENEVVTVNYTRNNNEPIVESDVIDINQDYFHVISLYALYNALMDREDDRYLIQQKKFQEQFKWYRSYMSRQVNWINNKIPSRHLRSF